LPQGYVQNATAAAAYGKLIDEGDLATVRGVAVHDEDRLRRDVIEQIMCGLEVDLAATAEAHKADPRPLLAEANAGMGRFVEDGLASWDGRRIAVTEKGRPFLRSVAVLFDAYIGRGDESKPRHSRAI
jgi:oxygen-independent coproporphyrinogen III oxidase